MSKYLLFIPLEDVNSAHSVASRDLFLILSRFKKIVITFVLAIGISGSGAGNFISPLVNFFVCILKICLMW